MGSSRGAHQNVSNPAQGLLGIRHSCHQLVTSIKSQRELPRRILQSPTREHTAPRHSLNSPGSCKMPRGKKKEPEPEPEENEVMEDAVRARPFHNSQNYASRPGATAAARDRGADPAQAARGAANRRRRLMIFHCIDDGDAPRCNLTRGLTPDLGTWPQPQPRSQLIPDDANPSSRMQAVEDDDEESAVSLS